MFGCCSTLRSVFLILMFLRSFPWNLGLTGLQLWLMSLDFIGGDPLECHKCCRSWRRALSDGLRSCSCGRGKKKEGWWTLDWSWLQDCIERKQFAYCQWVRSRPRADWMEFRLSQRDTNGCYGAARIVKTSFNLLPLHMPGGSFWKNLSLAWIYPFRHYGVLGVHWCRISCSEGWTFVNTLIFIKLL